MRVLGLFLLLAACDLQPPRRDAPTPGGAGSSRPAPVARTVVPLDAGAATPTTPPPSPPPAPPAVATLDAGVAEPATDGKVGDCTAVATHVTERLITNSPPDRRPIMEQERTRTVRTLARECTRQKWSDEIRGCFLAAQTDADIEVCSKKVAPAAPPAPATAPAPATPTPATEPRRPPAKQPAPPPAKQPAARQPAARQPAR